MVSIIIPAYNAALTLRETLESAARTQYSPLEIIVVDDGSSDATLQVAERFAATDSRVCVIHQPNRGVCVARNTAIVAARGEYILPLDADDLIEPTFIPRAVEVLKGQPDVKVVQPGADFFGERTGEWNLPAFSLRKLAKRNLIAACAMYRKSDWAQAGGYCEEMVAREDWDFWIALLKNGGRVHRLPGIDFHYRITHTGKRVADRRYNYEAIKMLNRRHPEFFRQQLGGPLRRMRSWSVPINCVARWLGLI